MREREGDPFVQGDPRRRRKNGDVVRQVRAAVGALLSPQPFSLATSSQSERYALLVSSLSLVQSVSQSVSQFAKPRRGSLGSCRPTEHGNTITTAGTARVASSLPLRPWQARLHSLPHRRSCPSPPPQVVMTLDCVTPARGYWVK